jgi:ABC-type multidrug transport system ATPase subunit
LTGSLMQGRTCILVTHALPLLLPLCQHVVLLEDGKVAYEGDPKDAGAELLIQPKAPAKVTAELHPTGVTNGGGDDKGRPEKQAGKTNRNLETQQVGAVDKDVYLRYLRDLGSPYWVATVLAVL